MTHFSLCYCAQPLSDTVCMMYVYLLCILIWCAYLCQLPCLQVRKRACTFLVRFCSELELKGITDKVDKVAAKTRDELKKALEEARKKKRESKENTR